MSASPPPAGYVTRTGAAEMLGWYPQRVTAAIKRGELAAFELDGRVLVKESDLDAFAARLSGEPTPLDPKDLP
ncbi:Uncharacterised protein [Mycobacteroides abscessus subsp. abscessus]|uniref:helix-turn-helix domain-containing protein n=1 Tax=Mycobacteroides abscessus TaxID=36809 RepID=UPI000925B930|nr:helix-turn-helix domain-containing protein [Mycobacteroides abscessus]SHX68138.1 Uncharacterised protein [Mycobacteroides abscessus subsp. abscessus]SIC58322.1 Uncharacterised protein [Mycobacteroides abscessus subsp. abscessus]SKK19422.1 Uncharacterised protein [Mycobacteroides abscessus subsp. abscessus]SKP49164.1 Uncharacterised protein [Mycobacteroides abscessus subsp. abscessus]